MDKRYKETYKNYIRLQRRNCLYNLDFTTNPDRTPDRGYLVGYDPHHNNFLFQMKNNGWARSYINDLTDEGYCISRFLKIPNNLWNVKITKYVIMELFKQQLQQLTP